MTDRLASNAPAWKRDTWSAPIRLDPSTPAIVATLAQLAADARLLAEQCSLDAALRRAREGHS